MIEQASMIQLSLKITKYKLNKFRLVDLKFCNKEIYIFRKNQKYYSQLKQLS